MIVVQHVQIPLQLAVHLVQLVKIYYLIILVVHVIPITILIHQQEDVIVLNVIIPVLLVRELMRVVNIFFF